MQEEKRNLIAPESCFPDFAADRVELFLLGLSKVPGRSMNVLRALSEPRIFRRVDSDLRVGRHKRSADLNFVVDSGDIPFILQRFVVDIYTLRCLRKLDAGLRTQII